MIRGIRGATTVSADIAQDVLQATDELLDLMQKENEFAIDDIASVLFTVTADLKSVFPAQAARLRGWDKVPLLCLKELEIDGSLPKCIRILIMINTGKKQSEIKHIYLRKAKVLRKDLLDE